MSSPFALMDTSNGPAFRVDHYPAMSRSLRIAFVTETYPPEVNGVALTVARMVEGMHERNHDLQLVRPRQTRADEAGSGPRFHEVLMRGLPIPRYPHLRMGMPAKKALVRLWSHHRPDVVHVATEGPLGFSALHAARKLQLPVTSDFRTNFHAYSQHYGIGFMRTPIMSYLRRFHNATTTTMVPTEPLRVELTNAGFRSLAVVSRGVDTALFAPLRRDPSLRRSWGVDEDDLVVACVGRLAPEKNLRGVLQTFAAIEASCPKARLLLVGDGPMEGELRRDAPHAIFAGRRDGVDLAAHFASADLFLMPSLTETFGNVTSEAMASGLPVVAFDYAAAAQMIVSNESGMLVRFGDMKGFVAASCRIAKDRESRVRFGAAARDRACAQDWPGIVARFEALLLQSVQQRPSRELFGAVVPSTA